MELFYIYSLCFSFLIFVKGIMMIIERKEYKGHYLYIHLYSPEKDKIQNKMLVIGLFRKWFKFKLFWYINLKVK